VKVIIVGCGRTGALTASMLSRAGHSVSVIDSNAKAFERLDDDYAGSTVHGNGIEQATLLAAGVEQADVFVAATSGDNRNIMTTQVAKEIFGVPKVIARIKDPARASIYEQMGIQVDCRTLSGVQAILEHLQLPA